MEGQTRSLPVHLVGVGSLGTAIGLLLAKSEITQIYIYDDDVVELKNIRNQLYPDFLVGVPKVEAFSWVLDALAHTRTRAHRQRVSSIATTTAAVICAVDNMATRRALYETAGQAPLFVDGRVGGDVTRLYFIRHGDAEERRFYESTLYDDSEASQDPCLTAATVHTCWSAASLIVSTLLKFLRGEPIPREIIFDHATLTMTSQ
jgi:molybdopterin/thiamine biosynthesis adenylyltransferase